MKTKQNKAPLSHSSIHIYRTGVMCHTARRTASPFQNPWNAHGLFRVLGPVVLHSPFPLRSLGSGSEGCTDFLGKCNHISHIFISSKHCLGLCRCFLAARAWSCPSTACHNPVRQAGQVCLFPSLGVRELKLRDLETVRQGLSHRRGQSVKTPPFLFLAQLSFTPWRALKQSDNAVTLLRIFPFLTLIFFF